MIICRKKLFSCNRYLLNHLSNHAPQEKDPKKDLKLNYDHNNKNSNLDPIYSRTPSSLLKKFTQTLVDVAEEVSSSFKLLNRAIKNPEMFKISFYSLIKEFKKFCEEKKNFFYIVNKKIETQYTNGVIDIAFLFETENDLNQFVVTTDSSNDGGYSSASLKLTSGKTGLFFGNIVNEVPKTGNITYSGFASLTCLRKIKSFGRPGYFDWRSYTHLVLKIRGDGRTWTILLSAPFGYEETHYFQYCHPLYTRGGPYWQITEIPFNHFYFTNKAKINNISTQSVPLNGIARLGFTLADTIDGPFKLEIDYIGLVNYVAHTKVSPYEQYYVAPRLTMS